MGTSSRTRIIIATTAVVLFLFSVFATVPPAMATSTGPSLTISPSTVRSGQEITVNGAGFPPYPSVDASGYVGIDLDRDGRLFNASNPYSFDLQYSTTFLAQGAGTFTTTLSTNGIASVAPSGQYNVVAQSGAVVDQLGPPIASAPVTIQPPVTDLSVSCTPNSLTWGQWTACTATVSDASPSVLFMFHSGSVLGASGKGNFFDPTTCTSQDPTCQQSESCNIINTDCTGHLTCTVVNAQCSAEFSLPNGTCFGNNGPCATTVSIWASTDTTAGTDPTKLPDSMIAVPKWGKVTFQDPVQYWGGPIQKNQLGYVIFWLPSSGCTLLANQNQSCNSSGGFVYDNPSIESAQGYPCGQQTACSAMASDTNYENLILQYFHDVGGSAYYHSIMDQYNGTITCCPHLGAERPPSGYIGGPGWVVDNTTAFPTTNGVNDNWGCQDAQTGTVILPRNAPCLYIADYQKEIAHWQHYFNGSLEGNPGNINTEFFIFLPYNVVGCYGITTPQLVGSGPPIGCSWDTSYQANAGLGPIYANTGICANSCSNAFHSFTPSGCNFYFNGFCLNIKKRSGTGSYDGTEQPFAIFYDEGTKYGFSQSMLAPACQGTQIPLGYYANGSGTCNVNVLNGTPNASFFADGQIPSVAHEQFETITNPLPFGFRRTLILCPPPPVRFDCPGIIFQSDLAWDQSAIGNLLGAPDPTSLAGAFLGEIGDLCKPTATADGPDSSVLDQIGPDYANVLLNGHKYLVYDIWSNSAGGCTLGPPVHYSFSGILLPHNRTEFHDGSTIPVTFQLKDANGNFISTAVARIWVDSLSNPGQPSRMSNIANYFRYDPTANQYVFDLNTKSVAPGSHTLYITLVGPAVFSEMISLT